MYFQKDFKNRVKKRANIRREKGPKTQNFPIKTKHNVDNFWIIKWLEMREKRTKN